MKTKDLKTAKKTSDSPTEAAQSLPAKRYVTIEGKRYVRGSSAAIRAGAKAFRFEFRNDK